MSTRFDQPMWERKELIVPTFRHWEPRRQAHSERDAKASTPSQSFMILPPCQDKQLKQVDSSVRKAIRSHVMRGRNKKKMSQPKYGNVITVKPTELRKSVSSLSGLPKVEDLDMKERSIVLTHFTLLVDAQYPDGLCNTNEPKVFRQWLEYLTDPNSSLLHAIIFRTQTYHEWIRRGKSLPENIGLTSPHLSKALSLLRDRLEDPKLATSDSTIATIVSLGIAATTFEEPNAAMYHMKGLSTIVGLRGGPSNLPNTLRLKLFRIDLRTAMWAGTKPMTPLPIDYERYIPTPHPWTSDLGLKTLFSYFDQRLTHVWADLREFCSLANDPSHKYGVLDYHEIMISILYRLLTTDGDRNTPEEALRLGMLVFSGSIFLQLNRTRTRFTKVADAMEAELQSFTKRRSMNPLAKVVLWLYFVDAISFVTSGLVIQAARLRSAIEDAGAGSWEDVRATLKSLLWIDVQHDVLGKRVYDTVMGFPGG